MSRTSITNTNEVWRFRRDLINIIILQGDREAKEFAMANEHSKQLFMQAMLNLTNHNRKILREWLMRLEHEDLTKGMFKEVKL